MGRRHGHQALDSGEGYGAALGGANQAAADSILAVVLRRRGEDAVGAEALHGHGHTVCEVREDRFNSGGATTELITQHPGWETGTQFKSGASGCG